MTYIKENSEFMRTISKEFEIVSTLKSDIRKLQKKLKSSSMKLNVLQRQQQDSSSFTDDNDLGNKKTVILEPEGLIFTVLDYEVEECVPNLVFEQKDQQGRKVTQYLYMNQSYKPFLIYL